MGTGSFPGVKRPGRGADHPPPSKRRGHERVGLYLYSPSGPQWPVIGKTFTFTYTLKPRHHIHSTKVTAKFRVLKAALLSIAMFRVVKLSRSANGWLQTFREIAVHSYTGTKCLRNVENYSSKDKRATKRRGAAVPQPPPPPFPPQSKLKNTAL